MKYGFRWRMFYLKDGKWEEPFRVPFKKTLPMLAMAWDRMWYGPVNRWVYVILPGIVDVNDHMWGLYEKKTKSAEQNLVQKKKFW